MTDDLAALAGRELAAELREAFGRIEHCLGQLTDEQAWWRPRADLNSVGNLVLHLAGNVRQLIGGEVGGGPTARDRQAEFDARGPLPRAELLARLRAAVEDAAAVLTAQSAAGWARACTFRGHAQEIIHLTRSALGAAYRFAGPPPGPPPT